LQACENDAKRDYCPKNGCHDTNDLSRVRVDSYTSKEQAWLFVHVLDIALVMVAKHAQAAQGSGELILRTDVFSTPVALNHAPGPEFLYLSVAFCRPLLSMESHA
tara:strand:+ start:193 stop:507 length:315 start_codon:yes stop_codon:yes gene_type:complete